MVGRRVVRKGGRERRGSCEVYLVSEEVGRF